MKSLLALAALALFAAAIPAGNVRAEPMGIAAVVNDQAISMHDVEDRIRLVLASSGIPDGKEIRAKITPQVVDSLIEEQLKIQRAKQSKLTVSDVEVDDGFKTIAEQNKFTPEQFQEIMTRQGVPMKSLKDQIRAQLAWNKFVKEKLKNEVDVSDMDVKTRVERMKGKIGQTEYLVSDILLPMDNPKRNAETVQFANRMAAELQAKKAPFGAVAAQFSKAAGAEKGGSLGWVQKGQIEKELDALLPTLAEGQVSDPVKTPTGLHIIMLQKKRTLTEAAIPPRDELMNQIGFERLDRAQQRALLDLKSAAFIDRRI